MIELLVLFRIFFSDSNPILEEWGSRHCLWVACGPHRYKVAHLSLVVVMKYV